MYTWLVYLHVIAVFGFLVAHGVSVMVAFALRKERNPERIRALLGLSGGTVGILYASILVLLLTGIANGFMGRWWGNGWIWVSLALLIGLIAYMSTAVSPEYNRVRKAVGEPYMEKYKPQPAAEPASSEELARVLERTRPVTLALVGFGGLALVTWLMIFKPF